MSLVTYIAWLLGRIPPLSTYISETPTDTISAVYLVKGNETAHRQFPHLCHQKLQIISPLLPPSFPRRRAREARNRIQPHLTAKHPSATRLGCREDDCRRGKCNIISPLPSFPFLPRSPSSHKHHPPPPPPLPGTPEAQSSGEEKKKKPTPYSPNTYSSASQPSPRPNRAHHHRRRRRRRRRPRPRSKECEISTRCCWRRRCARARWCAAIAGTSIRSRKGLRISCSPIISVSLWLFSLSWGVCSAGGNEGRERNISVECRLMVGISV